MKVTKMKSYEILKIVESLKQSKFDFTKLNRDTFFHSIRKNIVGKFAISCANISCDSCIFNSIGHKTESGYEIGCLCTISEYLKLCRREYRHSNEINQIVSESYLIEELIFNISKLLDIDDLLLEYSGILVKNEKH